MLHVDAFGIYVFRLGMNRIACQQGTGCCAERRLPVENDIGPSVRFSKGCPSVSDRGSCLTSNSFFWRDADGHSSECRIHDFVVEKRWCCVSFRVSARTVTKFVGGSSRKARWVCETEFPSAAQPASCWLQQRVVELRRQRKAACWIAPKRELSTATVSRILRRARVGLAHSAFFHPADRIAPSMPGLNT